MIRRLMAEAAYRLPRVKGKDRLLRGAIRAFSRGDATIVERGGVKYAVGGVDLIDYYIMANDSESPHVVDALAGEIGGDDAVLWDVGANVGGVALPLLKRCPRLRAVLFEPSPSVAGRLLRNLQLNRELSERATVLAAALSNKTGWAEFFPSGFRENSGLGGLARTGNRASIGLKVACFRGDELPADAPRPDFIKIDVEGFELDVLRGLGAIMERAPGIVFEHAPSLYPPRGLPLDAVIAHLQGLGYTVRSLLQPTIDLEVQDDLYATKPPKAGE